MDNPPVIWIILFILEPAYLLAIFVLSWMKEDAMHMIQTIHLSLCLIFLVYGDESPVPVRVMTDGFNCKEGIIIADQIRTFVGTDSLLKTYDRSDSTYIIVEITSYQDGGTAVINAGFAIVTPIQKNKLDYKFRRRLVSKTLRDMKEISNNIIEKIHVIRRN